jgi:hypothetical protein
MTTPSPAHPFHHRANPDGFWDTICPNCYLTVGRSPDEFPSIWLSQIITATKQPGQLRKLTLLGIRLLRR